MISSLFLTLITVAFLVALVALLHSKIESKWGLKFAFPKAVLLLLAFVSGVYQVAFIFHWPWLFTGLDIAALLACIFFHKKIFLKLKEYGSTLFLKPKREGEKILYLLYFFMAYLFFLSIFSVQGWDWDSMIFHLARPFLYLNEQTIFTTHYSDPRQVVWPMGGDILFYIFTRYGQTFGAGFISFLCYIATLVAIDTKLESCVDRKKAITLIFITASMPALVYSSTTVKGDPLAVFAFVMMWIAYADFHVSRNRTDLYTALLAFAFGLSTKMTFVFAGGLSFLAFVILEIFDRRPWSLKGQKLPIQLSILFILLCILLSQIHLYFYNYKSFGHLIGPTANLVHTMSPIEVFRNFFKYQLELIDFVLPLNAVGIPFIDTFLSFLYNHTIGILTKDVPWQLHYFPQEMNASFGPFGFFLAWIGIYRTILGRSKIFERLFAIVAFSYFLFIDFNCPREEAISIIRYLAPCIVTSFVLLQSVYNSPLLHFQKTILWVSIGLLTFCCTFNYAKPLIAYYPKAIPWYTYAFTNRDLLYKEKHFFDNRMDVFAKEVKPSDRVLILSKQNVWIYPYYQKVGQAKVRLQYYPTLPENWLKDNLNAYSLIVCEEEECVNKLNSFNTLQKIWQSSREVPRQAAYYRPK